MLGTISLLLRKGQCKGLVFISCVGAWVRYFSGLCAMACYVTSLAVVLWNIERLDAVLTVQEDIHEFEDFKRQIDHLNAQVLADEDSNVSMIQSIETHLSEQK